MVGLDNVNGYYNTSLKEDRLSILKRESGFKFVRMNLEDEAEIANLFRTENFSHVINLAGQAGMPYSLKNPQAFVKSNVVGFLNILEGCRYCDIEHLIYASSSSVYGLNTVTPCNIHQNVDHPLSLYAATKKADELMAHAYIHLMGSPICGPEPSWKTDRSKSIITGKCVAVLRMSATLSREWFAYCQILQKPDPEWTGQCPDSGSSSSPYRIYNIGNHNVIELEYFLSLLEDLLGKKAIRKDMPIRPGDFPNNAADVSDLMRDVGYNPSTPIETGLANFVAWYREYHNVK